MTNTNRERSKSGDKRNGPVAAEDVVAAVQLACLLEVSVPKPGNVSPGRHFSDARYEDFLASAAAIGGPMAGAGTRPVGATVRLAIEATKRWARSNTNLGMVLLLVPLARAALLAGKGPGGLTFHNVRDILREILENTTVDDARDVYKAIRIVSPGGLGTVEAEDVAHEPTMTLLEVMRIASHRDSIAREYATGFELTFEAGAPALIQARSAGLSWEDAIAETFLTLLAATPDTHIARRAGAAKASEVSGLARVALYEGGVRTSRGLKAIDELDRELRDGFNTRNPGTTADLTASTIFVVLLQGGFHAATR